MITFEGHIVRSNLETITQKVVKRQALQSLSLGHH